MKICDPSCEMMQQFHFRSNNKYYLNMKKNILIIGVFLLVSTNSLIAQNKKEKAPESIISKVALIKKYYDLKELKEMKKGELIALYTERIKVLVRTLPYIALATKPGISMADLGIPSDSENKKIFETQAEATEKFLEPTIEFQTKILPYSDKNSLIMAILFYESTLKSLHELGESSE